MKKKYKNYLFPLTVGKEPGILVEIFSKTDFLQNSYLRIKLKISILVENGMITFGKNRFIFDYLLSDSSQKIDNPSFSKNRIYLLIFIIILTNIKISLILSFVLLIPIIPKTEIKYLFLFLFPSIIFLLFLGISGNQEKMGLGLFVYSFRFNGIGEAVLYSILSFLCPEYKYLSGLLGILFFLGVSSVYIRNTGVRVFYWKFYFLSFLFMPVNHPWYFIPLMGLVYDRRSSVISELISLLLLISYINYTNLNIELKNIYTYLEIFLLIGVLYGRQCNNYFFKKFRFGSSQG